MARLHHLGTVLLIHLLLHRSPLAQPISPNDLVCGPELAPPMQGRVLCPGSDVPMLLDASKCRPAADNKTICPSPKWMKAAKPDAARTRSELEPKAKPLAAKGPCVADFDYTIDFDVSPVTLLWTARVKGVDCTAATCHVFATVQLEFQMEHRTGRSRVYQTARSSDFSSGRNVSVEQVEGGSILHAEVNALPPSECSTYRRSSERGSCDIVETRREIECTFYSR